jgi:expansin
MWHRAWCIPLVSVSVVVGWGCGGDDEGLDVTSGSSGKDDGGAGSGVNDGATTPSSDALAAKQDASGADAALGPEESGEATYYAADGTGACGFKATTNLDVAAMNKAQYSKANCGKCVSVTGPKGVVVVRIVDLCPGCSSGDLDLSKTAFAKIANLSAGRVAITWHFVACP